MLVARKLKMRAVKKNSEQEHKQQNFCVHDDIFSLKHVTRKIRVATTAEKQCTKKCAAREKLSLLFFAN